MVDAYLGQAWASPALLTQSRGVCLFIYVTAFAKRDPNDKTCDLRKIVFKNCTKMLIVVGGSAVLPMP